MQIPADELLRTYDTSSLQQIAKRRGVRVSGSAKEPIVQSLAPLLYEPNSIAHALKDVEPSERALLDLLILAGGEMTTEQARKRLESSDVVDPTPRSRSSYSYGYGANQRGAISKRNSRKFEDIVARLGALGLVFTTNSPYRGSQIVSHSQPGRQLFIPDDIMEHLPQVELPVETVATPRHVRQADPTVLLRDTYLLASFADREPLPLTKAGAIVKRSLVRVAGQLRRAEDAGPVRGEEQLAWLPFVRALAQETGIVAESTGQLVVGSRASEYLRSLDGDRRLRLYQAYGSTQRWNELFRVPDVTARGRGWSVRTAAPQIVAARQRVLTEMRALPVGEWIAIDHIIERIRTISYEFLFSRQPVDPFYAYSSYRHEVNPYAGQNPLGMIFDVSGEREGWSLVEGGFIRVIVTEALHALGIVDLGQDEQGRVVAFRITDDGAALLGDQAPASREIASRVVIQPNFQIFAFEPIGEDTLFTLDRVADRLRVDQAIEYELTRDSVYRAQQAGFETAQIVAFLESVSTVELPQNIRRTLEEWGAQHERITIRRRAPLLQTRDEGTLDALYADAALAGLLGRRLGPTATLVPFANLRALSEALIASERLPALTEGPDEWRLPRITSTDDGKLTTLNHPASVYVLSAVRELADAADDDVDGEYWLTASSLRRAAKQGKSAEEIIATLERLMAARPSEGLAALVRRWAKDWGQGAILPATILQVEQPETLDDLLSDPETSDMLQRIPDAPTIAIVRPKSVDRLRQLLEERGMALGSTLLR